MFALRIDSIRTGSKLTRTRFLNVTHSTCGCVGYSIFLHLTFIHQMESQNINDYFSISVYRGLHLLRMNYNRFLFLITHMTAIIARLCHCVAQCNTFKHFSIALILLFQVWCCHDDDDNFLGLFFVPEYLIGLELNLQVFIAAFTNTIKTCLGVNRIIVCC